MSGRLAAAHAMLVRCLLRFVCGRRAWRAAVGAGVAAMIAACAGPQANAPSTVPVAAPGLADPVGGAAPERERSARCGACDALALFGRVSAMSNDDMRRELSLLGRRFMRDPGESNRLALVMALLAARPPLRDDARLSRLIEGVETAGKPTDARELLLLLQRLVGERSRAVREEQRRGQAVLREEQRRSEVRLREEQDRANDLRSKLDALLEVERKVRRDPAPAVQ